MAENVEGTYRNTIGSIVSWALFRAAIVIGLALLLIEYVRWIDYSTWVALTLIMIYAAVIHPMQVQYRIYQDETKNVIDGTLCASCRYFEPTGVLCSKLDEHVSEDVIPCGGELWEPK
ncbi:MAG: hypothetical protein IH600_04410 [Bacteroidetes bacterium]|nr:hypothetical protein [Bacteroidota bacterium]